MTNEDHIAEVGKTIDTEGGHIREVTKKVELLPCPFCGSTKLKMDSKQTKAGYTGIDALVLQETFSIRCNVCHARGGAVGGKVIHSLLDVYKNSLPDWATTKEELRRKAIEAWNRRSDGNGKPL